MRIAAALVGVSALVLPSVAQACATTASYRSVVVNQIPAELPDGATLYRVRIDDAYVGEVTYRTTSGPKITKELHGIRGALLGDDGDRAFEIRTRLGSMCNTWTENWSDDHDVREGKMFGYLVGKPIGQIGDAIVIWPMLFRSAADRASMNRYRPGLRHGVWLLEAARKRPSFNAMRYKASKDGEWKLIRFDAEALAQNLPNTNRKIREGIEQLERESAIKD